MNNPSTCMQLDKAASYVDYQDALAERLSKASAVMVCLIGNDHWTRLSKETVSSAMWTVQTLISEAEALSKAAWEKRRST